jgi:hypothetical protein
MQLTSRWRLRLQPSCPSIHLLRRQAESYLRALIQIGCARYATYAWAMMFFAVALGLVACGAHEQPPHHPETEQAEAAGPLRRAPLAS